MRRQLSFSVNTIMLAGCRRRYCVDSGRSGRRCAELMGSHLAQTVRLPANEYSLSSHYTVTACLLLREAGAGWLSGQAQSSRQAYLHVVVSGIDRDRCHRIVSVEKRRLLPIARTQLAVLNTRIAAATTRLLLTAGETGNTRRAVCRGSGRRLGMEARGRHVFRAGPGG